MASRIIGDALHQELNMAFSFDEPNQDTLIVHALVGRTPYQIEIQNHPDFTFEEIKDALLTKQFKFVSRSPEILKIRIGLTNNFELKNIDKILINEMRQSMNEMRQSMNEMNNKLREYKQRNTELGNEMRREIAELKRVNERNEQKITELSEKLRRESEKNVELENRVRRLEEEFEKPENRIKELSGVKKIEEQKGSSKTNYKFSSTLKQQKIDILNNNTKASTSYGWYGLALVDGLVDKHSFIKFQITSIGISVAVGLGISNLIVNNQYKAKNFNQIGHGCYLLGYNGNSYSHSHKDHNNLKTDFTFDKQDVICVMLNGGELCFLNESQEKEHKMKIKLTAEEWQQACYCVYLSSNNNSSSVEIIDK